MNDIKRIIEEQGVSTGNLPDGELSINPKDLATALEVYVKQEELKARIKELNNLCSRSDIVLINKTEMDIDERIAELTKQLEETKEK